MRLRERGRGVNDTRDQALPPWGLWIRPEFPGVNQLGSCKPLGALVSPFTAPGPGRLQVGLWVRTLNVGAKHVAICKTLGAWFCFVLFFNYTTT